MDPRAQQFADYVADLTGLEVEIAAYPATRDLPQFLRQRYALYELKADGRRFVVVSPTDLGEVRPAAIEKQLRELPLNGAEGVCLLLGAVPGYVRQRLIERRIPFAIPGSQLYWPALGAVLQGRGGRQPPKDTLHLSPATQAVVLLALTGRITGAVTPKSLARELGYTPMSMTRAVDEIEGAELGQVTRQGRERLLRFAGDTRTLWERARVLMRNPVKISLRVRESVIPKSRRRLAGESALAVHTMLVPPPTPIYATGKAAWRQLKAEGVATVPLEAPGICTLQVWHYDPVPFANADCVDVFSLYLSLKDNPDERLERALDDLLASHFS